MRREAARLALSGVRGLIDGLDDGLVLLLAGRRRLVPLAAHCKRQAGLAAHDPQRERAVRARSRRLGALLGVPEATSDHLVSVLIADAYRQQALHTPWRGGECAAVDPGQGGARAGHPMLSRMTERSARTAARTAWLRFLPPPARLSPLLRRVPHRWQARWLEAAMRRVLAAPLASGLLAPLQARRIGIEVSDLGLRWVVCVRDGRLQVLDPDAAAEATVRGTATDLLLLASRREDADTLFFQRRLVLTGDTELGLTARNLLDQLPWETVPLGLRIVLHRGAGFVQAARAAYRGEPSSV
ncbi:ubiquinone anaerobic biosynthesis accessory factor UbiT [Vulcaniibacterium gelatinicum]|uniref:ubiquinone anaerobic biosynthesis accessory factor UbiT n=1 Tax=Vulcaniibacterium gelatinicum TaxID=2598725 RepID=UPI0011CA09F7|nr:SCP2 sterol-binding domain-containing protein [Vulcaniibacterium gelatinicum]